jgi:hypothetical protein
MRAAFIILGIILSASVCFAQGELLSEGQSAFLFYGGVSAAHQLTSGGGGIGYSFDGAFDLAGGLTRTTLEGWAPVSTISAGVEEHIWRNRESANESVILSLCQAVNLMTASGELGRQSSFALDLGVSGTYRRSLSRAVKVLYSAGYVRTILTEEGKGSVGALLLGATLAHYNGRIYLSLAPSVSLQADRTTIGLTVGITSVQRPHK